MQTKTLAAKIDTYMSDPDLFFDFSAIHDVEKPFSTAEKIVRQRLAAKWRDLINKWDTRGKCAAFKRKLGAADLANPLKSFGWHGKLKNVVDYTSTVDYRIPREQKISHQVVCLVFEKETFFLKASRKNAYEEKYQRFAKRLKLPSIRVTSAQHGRNGRIVLSEGITSAVPLSKTKNFSAEQLGGHAAIADFLNKGGRNPENYLVSKGDVYAIDNEFLHNEENVFFEDLQKGYHELFALQAGDFMALVDALFAFIAGYARVARRLRLGRRKIDQALQFFFAQHSSLKMLNNSDRKHLLQCLFIQDFKKDISVLSKHIGNTSPVLRKTLRQSSWITENLFGFTPTRSISNNFDSKTFVLRGALEKTARKNMKILEIGPGCNATLSLFLKKKWPSLAIDAVELNDDFIVNARKTAKANHLDVHIMKGDIVQRIKKKYDLIFWNLPFVTSNKKELKRATGKLFASLERFATESDDGTNLIKRFLSETPKRLKNKGLLLFASNNAYVPHRKILRLIETSNLRLVRAYAQRSNTSRAYMLVKK